MKTKLKLLKRLGSLLVALIMSLTYLAPQAFASGNVNAGVLPGTSSTDYRTGYGRWLSRAYGARVTLVDATTGSRVPGYISIDYCTHDSIEGVLMEDMYHFETWCKSDYRDGEPLGTPYCDSDYVALKPPAATDESGKVIATFPVMLNNGYNQNTNETQIKNYFGNANVISEFAYRIGATYEEVTSGKYKFLVEPIAYIKSPEGDTYAVTITEMGLWNKETRSKDDAGLGYVQRKWGGLYYAENWPKSLFLQESDIGYPAWNPLNGKTKYVYYNESGGQSSGYGPSDDQIISSLGLATIAFDPGDPTVHHHIYIVKLNVPKGNTLSYNGRDIPLFTANITKILKGSPVKDDKGTEVSGGAELAKAMLNYCNAKGFIVSKGTSGVGVWEEVVSYTIDDKTEPASSFVKADEIIRYLFLS